MSDQANAIPEEMEILGEKVKPVTKLEQRTVVDAVKFVKAEDSQVTLKVGDDLTLLDGTVVKILRIKAAYADKTVAFVYEEGSYKDEQSGFEFPQEKIFGITGVPFECMTHDEVNVKLDKKATMMMAQAEKAKRLKQAQDEEAARTAEQTQDQAKEDSEEKSEPSTATPDGVEPDSNTENSETSLEENNQ